MLHRGPHLFDVYVTDSTEWIGHGHNGHIALLSNYEHSKNC